MVEDKPQTTVVPEITPGVDGAIPMANVLAALLEQALLAVTEMVPDINVDANTTGKLVALVTIGEVPKDEVTPVGRVQV